MDNKFPVIGIDVAKEFCYFAILGPDSKAYVNPTKIMNDESGWDSMLESFKKADEAFNEKPTILLESTGHFSESLVRFLIKNDYRVFLINPLQSHFHLSEQRVLIINQLTAALDQAMPNFTKIFLNIYKFPPLKS